MSNTTSNNSSNILNSWSLIAFAKSHGRMQVGSFTQTDDKGNTRSWKSCIFTNPKNSQDRTFVAFSRNLGELSSKEIAQQKDELQVVECLTHEGNKMFSLCKQGQNSWEDVDLGL